jgi:hypothetical protein
MGHIRYAGSVAIMGLALGLTSVQGAHAAVVISDDFAGTPQANWPGDATFISVPPPGNTQGLPSVDLVGPGFFPQLAPATGGNAVDLDGSTGSGHYPAGDITSIKFLKLGNYSVQFLLAGNLRGATPETTEVCIGLQCQAITPANDQPYTPYNLTFINALGNVSFFDKGPSDQIGNLLADVVVTARGPNVGEGFLGFAAMSVLLIAVRYRGLIV